MLTFAELEALPSFALLGPGFTGGVCRLYRDLRPGTTLRLRTFEGQERGFDGDATDVELAHTASAGLTVRLERGDQAAAVEAVREAIRAGDVYQVCYTMRARIDNTYASAVAAALCRPGLPRFFAWLRAPGIELVSGSPELLLAADGRAVLTEPMKGTAPSAADLTESEKDRAELAMIVDLVRNDLTPVCVPRTVRVLAERAFVDVGYATQTVARVGGELLPGLTARDAVDALFPGGSVVGCPKPAALQHIRALEPEPRGAYCGTLGLFEGERARVSLLIRTAERRGDGFVYGVGSGVVIDSEPDREWDELAVKLRAVGP